MSTLKDVAEELGISISAVSLAVRNHESISLETRQKVWSAQERLGYTPRARRKSGGTATSPKRHDKIAFMLVDRSFNDSRYASGFHVIAEKANATRQDAAYLSVKLADLHAGILPSALRNREVDGVIVSGVYDRQADFQLKSLKIPLVVLGNYELGEEPYASCENDIDLGMNFAVRRLAEFGHRQVGLILRTRKTGYATQFLRSFEQRTAEHGITISGIESEEDNALTVNQALLKLLARPTPPTAVLFPMERMAVEAYIACGKENISVPRDLSLVTFASTDDAYPFFLKVISDPPALGRRAFEKLMDLIADPSAPLTREIFPMKLIPGESVMPPRVKADTSGKPSQ